ncbi:MAG: ABC transporter substrate-binding protein, partial [Myxococcota bacterium]
PVKCRSELKISLAMKKTGKTWRVYDSVVLVKSTMEGIKKDQVDVLLKDGGIARVKKAMSDQLAKVGS